MEKIVRNEEAVFFTKKTGVIFLAFLVMAVVFLVTDYIGVSETHRHTIKVFENRGGITFLTADYRVVVDDKGWSKEFSFYRLIGSPTLIMDGSNELGAKEAEDFRIIFDVPNGQEGRLEVSYTRSPFGKYNLFGERRLDCIRIHCREDQPDPPFNPFWDRLKKHIEREKNKENKTRT